MIILQYLQYIITIIMNSIIILLFLAQVSRKGTGFLSSEQVQAMVDDDDEEEATTSVRFDHASEERDHVWAPRLGAEVDPQFSLGLFVRLRRLEPTQGL